MILEFAGRNFGDEILKSDLPVVNFLGSEVRGDAL